tara:strand:+ start:488 stop:1099 length:612 start_codon:yes stop_codon:yes gene_type:complete
LKKLRNSIKILLLILVISSCKNEKRDSIQKKFYYPNKTEFSTNKTYKLINLKSFENFGKLVDSLENLKYYLKKPYLKIKSNKEEFNIIVSTNFGGEVPSIHKFRNILSLNNDRVEKDRTYSISKLKKILKKDLENYGQNDKFSESPKKLIVSVTSEMDKLEFLLLKICRTFNEIKGESSDTLELNIYLNRLTAIYPPPLKIEH